MTMKAITSMMPNTISSVTSAPESIAALALSPTGVFADTAARSLVSCTGVSKVPVSERGQRNNSILATTAGLNENGGV